MDRKLANGMDRGIEFLCKFAWELLRDKIILQNLYADIITTVIVKTCFAIPFIIDHKNCLVWSLQMLTFLAVP